MSQSGNQMQAESPDFGAPPIQHITSEPEPARLGPGGRLIGTILSPGETFQDVNRKPTWLIPMLVIMVFGAAFAIFVNSQTDEGWRQFMSERMRDQSGGSGGNLTPQQMEMGVKFGKWSTVALVSLWTTISSLIIAGVFALALMIMQAQTTFKKILSVVAWSGCATGIVQMIVNLASLMARGSESVSRLQPKDWPTISATNLSFAFPSDSSPALLALAASIDIFSIWFLILLIIGFTAISGVRKITRGKVATMVIGLWVVGILVKVASASVIGG
jgi:hypothetical protein